MSAAFKDVEAIAASIHLMLRSEPNLRPSKRSQV